jgi:hypothetical protein
MKVANFFTEMNDHPDLKGDRFDHPDPDDESGKELDFCNYWVVSHSDLWIHETE